MDKFKDIMYEVSDLLFGFVVLLFIVFTINYQLHGWFRPVSANTICATNTSEIKVENAKSSSHKDKKADVKQEKEKKIETEIVSFKINQGDAGFKIAQNLKSAGLISSTKDFLYALDQSHLGNRMKSGTYKIQRGSSINEVIHILTK